MVMDASAPAAAARRGIQQALAQLGAVVRIDEATLTPDEATEYGAWKRLGMAPEPYGRRSSERS